MAIYVGFTTQNSNRPRTSDATSGVDGGVGSLSKPIVIGKKYRLTDQLLVQQDFINALNIRQGSKVGNPAYGTILWDFIFEPNSPETNGQIELEVRRVASLDPRIVLGSVQPYPSDEGVLIEIQLAFQPFNNETSLSLFFSKTVGTII
jgi:phage baseplate assembly protein W